MAKKPTDLDKYRGMATQKETELRRDRQDVQLDEMNRRVVLDELEQFLAATPAISLVEAAEKMRYLLGILARTPEGMESRRIEGDAKAQHHADIRLAMPHRAWADKASENSLYRGTNHPACP